MAIGKLYGSTYFKCSSGRLLDGRFIIDFIAYGLPFLPPYKNITKSQDDVKKGVNFAYGGATALDVNYFKGGRVINSLNMQFDWFKKLKPSSCKTKEECDSFFKKLLFVVGEIGRNDVLFDLSKTITELREMVPLIVESIKKYHQCFTLDNVEILKACCGGSGPYHFDDLFCGWQSTTICSDPSKLINWDGPHFTEAAHKQITKGLIEGHFANPSLKPAPFKIV
ncbi:putative carboxylesterase [Medicago truncatula]|uniref:Putative carboxylesterase n=1 Tax=Medicago truncatula TaxID=3880 RepID=A0A396ITL4_MEDTR|nr:putative carboxylesterase [Medicago truncatula]